MGFEHGRRVRKHHRHRIARAYTAVGECGGQPPCPIVICGVTYRLAAVNDRGMIGKKERRALEIGQWSKWLKIGGVAIEVAVVEPGALFMFGPYDKARNGRRNAA